MDADVYGKRHTQQQYWLLAAHQQKSCISASGEMRICCAVPASEVHKTGGTQAGGCIARHTWVARVAMMDCACTSAGLPR